MIEWLSQYWHFIVLGFELIASVIIYCMKCKSAKTTEEKLKLKEAVLASISVFCIEAENLFGKGNGVKKKQWALQQAKLKCVELGVTIPDDTLEASIEEVVKATNSVNTNKGV